MGYKVPKRQANRDYRLPGKYFVTICTYRRAHFFGRCKAGIMTRSPIGDIANSLWFEMPDHLADVQLGAFVIMPNHVHGIVEIMPNGRFVHLPKPKPIDDGTIKFVSEISPMAGSLSQMIRSFKSAVTREARLKGHDFAWQKSFHDHVIKPGEEDRITNYILNNPKTWEEDGFYTTDVGGYTKND